MYINSYILAVPAAKKKQYMKIAEQYAGIASEYGAIEIFENWERDVPDGKLTDYRKAVKAKPGEKIVVSWVIWPDRRTAELAHKKLYEDPRLAQMGPMPFDGKRMVMGNFEPIVHFRK